MLRTASSHNVVDKYAGGRYSQLLNNANTQFHADRWRVDPDRVDIRSPRVAKYIAGRSVWLSYSKSTDRLSVLCQARRCTCRASSRIVVNVWGCLYEVDVCKEHRRLDGAMIDSI